VRVLTFRHVPFEGLGLIEPALESRGVAIDYADLYRAGSESPDIDGYHGLIFLGGPMSANDSLPYLNAEMRLIERALAAETPVLGVCLGAQLIAKTLGAPVYRNTAPEIGWYDITLTEAAGSDALFAGLDPVEKVFHWHSDTFDLPAGAALLARSERTERQAFRYGRVVHAVQFHLEVTPQMIVDWCVQDHNCGDVRELSALPDPLVNRQRLDSVSQLVFGRWCDLLLSRAKEMECQEIRKNPLNHRSAKKGRFL
jgi:GMP synthase (glutamine-hydrolysing)